MKYPQGLIFRGIRRELEIKTISKVSLLAYLWMRPRSTYILDIYIVGWNYAQCFPVVLHLDQR